MFRLLAMLVVLAGCGPDADPGLSFSVDPWPDTPLLPPATGPRLLLPNAGEDTISVVDPDQFVEIARIPVGLSPVASEAPWHVEVDPAGRSFYVSLSEITHSAASGPHQHGAAKEDGHILKLDAATGLLLTSVRTRRRPADLVLSPRGDALWESHSEIESASEIAAAQDDPEALHSQLVAVDPVTLERVGASPVCERGGRGIGFAAGGTRIYTACSDDVLAVLDDPAREPRLVPLVEAPRPDYGRRPVAVSPADGRVWVSDDGEDAPGLRVLDPDDPGSLPIALTTEGLPGHGAFTASGDTFYVVTLAPDLLLEVDPEAVTVLRTLDLATACEHAHGVLVSADDRTLWVACEGDHFTRPGAVLEVDRSAFTIERHIDLGLQTYDIALLPEAL